MVSIASRAVTRRSSRVFLIAAGTAMFALCGMCATAVADGPISSSYVLTRQEAPQLWNNTLHAEQAEQAAGVQPLDRADTCDYSGCAGYIYGGDGSSVINANACGTNNALLVMYALQKGTGCGDGANEYWSEEVDQSTGYIFLQAYYANTFMCINVYAGDIVDDEPMVAHNCNTEVTANEEFRHITTSPNPYGTNTYYIVPALSYPNFSYTVSAVNGFTNSSQIELYTKDGSEHQAWGFGDFS